MKNLRPIGIPQSIFLENILPRTYDASKLEEDAERVRAGLSGSRIFPRQRRRAADHICATRAACRCFTFRPKKGKRIDITMPIDEGERYRLGSNHFHGQQGSDQHQGAARASSPSRMVNGSTPPPSAKGSRTCARPMASLATSTLSASPTPPIDEAKKTVSFNIDIDEGKPFYVSRIEFQGNTVTRDFVIRRELLLEEGQVYNSHLWELSLLRLNQLDYFDPLKVDQDSETHQNAEDGTVELLLKVNEKGKNTIGLNGGVSGLSGSFLGLNYQTNNFLGLGETLSVQASAGNVSRNLLFGFNEPYVRNRPLNVGFQIFSNKYDYNAPKNYKLAGGNPENLSTATQSLLQNYNQSSNGFTVSARYPIRHSFKSVGVTYSLQQIKRHCLQRRIEQLLPDAGLPQRHSGPERAQRHHQQHGFVQLLDEQAGCGIPCRITEPRCRPRCRLRVCGATCAISAPSSNTAIPSHQRPQVQSRGTQRIRLPPAGEPTFAVSAATSLRRSTASTRAEMPICEVSTSARLLPTALFRRACSSTSPIPTAAPCRAIPPILPSVPFRCPFRSMVLRRSAATPIYGEFRVSDSDLCPYGQLCHLR